MYIRLHTCIYKVYKSIYQYTISDCIWYVLFVTDSCPAAVVEIRAVQGQFVEGAVTPAIHDLTIELRLGENVITSVSTDKQGKYR